MSKTMSKTIKQMKKTKQNKPKNIYHGCFAESVKDAEDCKYTPDEFLGKMEREGEYCAKWRVDYNYKPCIEAGEMEKKALKKHKMKNGIRTFPEVEKLEKDKNYLKKCDKCENKKNKTTKKCNLDEYVKFSGATYKNPVKKNKTVKSM